MAESQAPHHEDEVEIVMAFKDFGYPYAITDDRALVWIQGFRAGMHHGGEIAARAVRDTLAG